MKKLVITAMLFALASCEEPNVQTKETTHKIGPWGHRLQVIEIEGCEYFFATYDRGVLFAHKGNCKNPEHYENN